jgi:hypothetical protein
MAQPVVIHVPIIGGHTEKMVDNRQCRCHLNEGAVLIIEELCPIDALLGILFPNDIPKMCVTQVLVPPKLAHGIVGSSVHRRFKGATVTFKGEGLVWVDIAGSDVYHGKIVGQPESSNACIDHVLGQPSESHVLHQADKLEGVEHRQLPRNGWCQPK